MSLPREISGLGPLSFGHKCKWGLIFQSQTKGQEPPWHVSSIAHGISAFGAEGVQCLEPV